MSTTGRNAGAIRQSRRDTDPTGYRGHTTASYTPHLTEAERIAWRICEGGVPTQCTETRARQLAEVNEQLRPRRFSWEWEQ